MFDNFPLWPARASTAAGNVDALYIFLLIVSGMMTLLIFAALVVFAARYRHRKGVLAEQIEGSIPLEITWSIIPLGVFMVIFAWGAVVYFKERTPPRDASEVYVVANNGCGSCSMLKASARSTLFTFPLVAMSSSS
jgi:cytochrome c oxidase subunit 2